MGKRRIGFKKPKKGIDNLKNVGSSDEEQIENDLDDLLNDEIDSYNAYKDQSLASKNLKSKKRHSDSDEEEVFGLDLSSEGEDGDVDLGEDEEGESEEEGASGSDEDNDEDILGDDMEGEKIPDIHAWGRKARLYHNTDYVDKDFGGFEGSDAELAEQEEAEAKEIQKRLTAELDEEAFLQFIPAKVEKPKKKIIGGVDKEILKIDFDSLSMTEKRKLVQRECPEIIHMLDEYKEKLLEAQELKKLMSSEESELIREFYETKYHTMLNYCINISFYLYLRASNPGNSKGHPVIKRVLQFRRLLEELEQFNPESVKLSISKIQKPLPTPEITPRRKPTPRKLKPAVEDVPMEVEPDGPELLPESEKRGITYEMKKNKGLTPARQKVQRNPRVKHRLKYRKATIRRKGQVRTPRTEIRKYDGEISGIKSHLTKSIKLK